MQLVQFRQHIIDTLKLTFPKLNVSAYQGRFDLDELKRLSIRLPALQIAILSIDNVETVETDERDMRLQLAAFVLTRDHKRLEREAAALAIVERLALLIPYQRWNYSKALIPTNLQVDNLFSGPIDKQGVALWAVSWQQILRLGIDVWAETLPAKYYAPDVNEIVEVT